MGFEFDDLDDFLDGLERAEKEVQEQIPKIKQKTATGVLEDVVENTPVNKDPRAVAPGTLRRSWKVRDISSDTVEVYNDAKSKNGEFYAWHVEYGHRTRLGTTKVKNHTKIYRPDGKKKVAFVRGVKMLDKALKHGEGIIEKECEKALEKILGEI